MSENSKIEWTETSWNPLAGCSRISAGCGDGTGGGCYAERMAHRLSGNPKTPQYHGVTRLTPNGPRFTGVVNLALEKLAEPLRWRKPRRIFVNSMSDLFHKDVPDEYIAAVFGVMAACPQHTFQVLTKRADRLPEWFAWLEAMAVRASDVFPADDPGWRRGHLLSAAALRHGVPGVPATAADVWPLPNVWIGVSVENQATADKRTPHLLQVPAAVRFVSAEPLLGPVDLAPWISLCRADLVADERGEYSASRHDAANAMGVFRRREAWALHWVIVGGESGPSARPMHPDWARSIRDQCVEAGVPYFFKQWGAWVTEGQSPEQIVLPSEGLLVWDPDGPAAFRVGKKHAGRLLDGRTWDQFPEEVSR